MESAWERPNKGADIIPLPVRREVLGGELKEFELAEMDALRRLTDANSMDEPASAEVFRIGAQLHKAQSDEERVALTAQLDEAREKRYRVWDDIREARLSYEKAKEACKEAQERQDAVSGEAPDEIQRAA